MLHPGERILRAARRDARVQAPKQQGWRERPGTILLWWWLPSLLAVGLLNGGSALAAFVVAALALTFAAWAYRPDA